MKVIHPNAQNMHHLSHANQLHMLCVTASPFHTLMSCCENLSACLDPCVVTNDL